MTADQKRLKTMMVGMALIISLSGVMHVYLVRKKAIRTHRYEPQYGNTSNEKKTSTEMPGSLRGEVIAVSYDKFFLRADGEVQTIAIGVLRMPEVGQTITVTHQGGTALTAVAIQDAPPTAP